MISAVSSSLARDIKKAEGLANKEVDKFIAKTLRGLEVDGDHWKPRLAKIRQGARESASTKLRWSIITEVNDNC